MDTYAPADAGDFRFEIEDIGKHTEDPFMQFRVLTVDDQGEVIACDIYATEGEVYSMIEAAREAQAMTLEERFDHYAELGW